MEIFAGMIRELWAQLDTATVPILDVSFKTFLISVLILKCVIDICNFLLGKVTSPVTKTSIDDETSRYVNTRSINRQRSYGKFNGFNNGRTPNNRMAYGKGSYKR